MSNVSLDQFEFLMNTALQNLDEFNKFLHTDYLITRGHAKRLKKMLGLVAPFCNTDTHFVDLGSNIFFLAAIKLLTQVKECQGIDASYEGHGATFTFKPDLSFEIEPLTNFPYSNEPLYPGCATLSMLNYDLSKDRLPYKNNTIDVITCFETLEHLTHDPMNLLVEVNRIIKDDGIFFLSTPNANSLSNIKKILNFESPYFYPPFIPGEAIAAHIKEYSINEIQLLFESAGFEIIQLDTFNHEDSEEFSHYENYQVHYKDKKDAELEALRKNDKAFAEDITQFLSKYENLNKHRGDYILVTAKKCSDVKDRNCFPVYENLFPLPQAR